MTSGCKSPRSSGPSGTSSTITSNAQPAKISVAVNQPGHKISPILWGIFFEDINLSADGGLYPELVRNRSFEDSEKPDFWKITGAEATIDDSVPLNYFNRRYLRLKLNGRSPSRMTVIGA